MKINLATLTLLFISLAAASPVAQPGDEDGIQARDNIIYGRDSNPGDWNLGHIQRDRTCQRDEPRCEPGQWDFNKCKCRGKWCDHVDRHCGNWNWHKCECKKERDKCHQADHRCKPNDWNWERCHCKKDGKWCHNHDPNCRDWDWGKCGCKK
ncbi:hypothetical protein BBP40_002496, partial [Aspergillus hancockii]